MFNRLAAFLRCQESPKAFERTGLPASHLAVCNLEERKHLGWHEFPESYLAPLTESLTSVPDVDGVFVVWPRLSFPAVCVKVRDEGAASKTST